MNLDAFLKRIGLETLPDDPLERLQMVHRAMVLAVPFENLEILEGRAISLNPETIFDKIVRRQRGGYCFELNGIFARILETLGYEVEPLLGRVWAGGNPAPLLTHMALRVTVAGTAYLCDVGFGSFSLREPLPWVLDEPVPQEPDCFRLVATDNRETVLQNRDGQTWKDLYSTLPCSVRMQDFIPANHYTSTHPDSFFTQIPVAALTTRDGRITLRGRLCRHIGAGGTLQRELESMDELFQVLSTDFGLTNLDRPVLEGRLATLFEP